MCSNKKQATEGNGNGTRKAIQGIQVRDTSANTDTG